MSKKKNTPIIQKSKSPESFGIQGFVLVSVRGFPSR